MIFQITDIAYDLDDAEITAGDLPSMFTVSIPEYVTEVCSSAGISELLSEYISDTTGFCHKGFNYHQVG